MSAADRNNPPRVLFIEQFYFPEGWGGAALPRDVTVHLQRHGFAVEVVCGSEPYVSPQPGDLDDDPGLAGVRMMRVPRLLAGDIHRRKLLRQLWFYLALIPLLFLRRPPAVYVVQTNPPLAAVMAAVAAWSFRRPLVIIAQDLYPETLVAHGMLRSGGAAERMLRSAFAWAYRSARNVVVLGPVMHARVADKGVASSRITTISNWATGAEGVAVRARNALRSEWELADRFVLLYSGNLGIGHEFDTLLDGVQAALIDVPDLALVFVGQGSRLQEVKAGVAARDLGRVVQFRSFLPAARLPESFGLADVAIVTMRQGFEGLIVPSKLLGHMARGVPTLYVGPVSDVSVLVEEAGCGFVAAPGRADSVRDAIVRARNDRAALEQMGARGRYAYESSLTREHGLERYLALLRDVVQSKT